MEPLSLLFFVILAYSSFSHCTVLTNELSKASVTFSSKLYKEVAKRNPSNFLISPLSLKISLGMVAPAARGKTYKEIIRALHVKNELKIAELIENISNSPVGRNASLISANKIYVSDSFNINPNYLENVKDKFKSQIQTINFINSKEAAKQINKWIEKRTKQKIRYLISPNDLDDSTMLVLLNALYFHDKWLHPFNKSITERKRFHVNSTTSVNVDMMKVNITTETAYNANLKANFLKLPYANEDIAMYIVIPNSIDGIHDLEKRMKEILSTKVDTLSKVEVYFPKFVINSSNDFIPVLKRMGMQQFLGNNPDLSGMVDSEARLLQIGVIRQSAMVEVNEQGTVAAASTTIVEKSRSGWIPYIITIDRPFILYIKYKGEILFIGRLYLP